MDDQQARWQSVLFVIQAIATAAGVVKLIDDLFRGQVSLILAGLFLGLVVIQGAIYLIGGRRKYHALEEGTARFSDFFTKWYSRAGHHTIYCDDLDWLEGNQEARIVQAISTRAQSFEIFVREDRSPIVAQLRQAGVPVRIIPVSYRTRTSMSLHSSDGHETVIFRSKSVRRGDRHKIGFIETSAKYYTDMAQDLFAGLRGIEAGANAPRPTGQPDGGES